MAATAPTSRGLPALAAALVLAACLRAAPAAAAGTRYTVGGPDGWRVPPPEAKDKYYADWASGITFYVDDSVEFVYRNDSVMKVGKAGYYHCNETVHDAPPRDATTLFVLDAPGPAYFASADLDHCNMGERLMVDVHAAATAPPPWPAAPGPWASPSPAPAHHSTAAPPSSATAHALVVLVLAALALPAGLI